MEKKTRDITKIIVHCTDTPRGRSVTFDEIKRWHVEERKFSDIGYHFVVMLDGTIYPGRPLKTPGAHTKGENKCSIGIAYVGGRCKDNKIAEDTRTKYQKDALFILIQELMMQFTKAKVYGHRDFSDKPCPSFNAKAEYSKEFLFDIEHDDYDYEL